MSSPFVAAMDSEIDALEAELSVDVRYIKLKELRRIRSELYGDGEQTGVVPIFGGSHSVSRPPVRKASPERTRALEMVALYLRNRVPPVPTGEIYDHLEGLGVQIGGANPRNNLSAMLSNSDLFESEGRRGWRLREQAPAKSEHEEPSYPRSREKYEEICNDFFGKLSISNLFRAGEHIERHHSLPSDLEDSFKLCAEIELNRDVEDDEYDELLNVAVDVIQEKTSR